MLLPIGKGCAITPPNTSVWTYLTANFLRKLAKNLKSKTIANTTSSICSFILPFFQKNKITSKYRLSLHYRLKSHRFFTYGEQSLMLMLPIKCSCYATTFDCYAIVTVTYFPNLLQLKLHHFGKSHTFCNTLPVARLPISESTYIFLHCLIPPF